MDLRRAITTAAKFCWKGKQNSPMKSIRFIPRTTTERPALFAHNGPDGVCISVDLPDLPNAMFDGQSLANAVKGTKEDIAIEQVNGRTWKIAGVHLDSGDVTQYPTLPVIPQSFTDCEDWWAVEQVMHAVSKNKHREDLMCVNFTADAVEATDRHRVARVFVRGDWKGLVPAHIFKNMPQGAVGYAFTDNMATFRVGDEVRMVMLKTGRFEDCASVLPAHYDGPSYAVRRPQLFEAVKRITGLKADRVTLRFNRGDSGVGLHLQGGGFTQTFVAEEISAHPALPVEIEASAAQLLEALKVIQVPCVRLGFTNPGEPFRLDAGPLAMGFWAFTE